MVTRICQRCGKTFNVFPSRIKTGRGKFCSKECVVKPKIKKICKRCGKEFFVQPCREKTIYCRHCYHTWFRKQKVKEICKICGKEFSVSPYKIKQGNNVFCSKKCASKSFAGRKATMNQQKGLKIGQKICGELHGNWNGGVSKLPYSLNFTKKLKEEIRFLCFNKCHICGISNDEHKVLYERNLHIHHIDYNKLNTSKHNLVSLCCICHPKTNKNREVWKEYFSTWKELESSVGFLKDKTVCFSYGVWDIIHAGHINILKEARKLCDYLIVGVVSDKAVREKKGEDRPFLDQLHRAFLIGAFKYVDKVVLQKEYDPSDILLQLKETGINVNILAKGDDWDYIPGTETIESIGGKLVKISYTKGVSTSQIVKKIRGE